MLKTLYQKHNNIKYFVFIFTYIYLNFKLFVVTLVLKFIKIKFIPNATYF